MTAATQDRKATQYGTPDLASGPVTLLGLPVAASTKLYAGTMVATNSTGYAVPASASTAQKLWGRCEKQVDNSAGANGDLSVNVKPGIFYFANSTGADLIAQANLGAYVYAVDDSTVALTDSAGTRPVAGYVVNVDTNLGVAVAVGQTNPYVGNPELNSGGSSQFKARGVVFANVADLTAFTVAANDGITYAAGDVVLLAAQTTAAQNGPYVVGPIATTTAALTRPDWWATGSGIVQGQVIQVGGEGTIFGGSEWKALCAKAKIVGTDDPLFYPRVSKGTVTLVAGTKTLGATQGLFIKSTTTSPVQVTRNTFHAGSTTTVTYDAPVANRTAGVSGTAALIINGCAAAGTHPGDDASDVDFLVTNW